MERKCYPKKSLFGFKSLTATFSVAYFLTKDNLLNYFDKNVFSNWMQNIMENLFKKKTIKKVIKACYFSR